MKILEATVFGCKTFQFMTWIFCWDALRFLFKLVFFILGVTEWTYYLPVENTLPSFLLAFVLLLVVALGVNGYRYNRPKPLQVYLCLRTALVVGILLCEILNLTSDCQRTKDQAEHDSYFEEAAESCDTAYSTFFNLIVELLVVALEIHLTHIIWSYIQKLKRGDFGELGQAPDLQEQNILREGPVFSMGQPVIARSYSQAAEVPEVAVGLPPAKDAEDQELALAEPYNPNIQVLERPPPVNTIPVFDFTKENE